MKVDEVLVQVSLNKNDKQKSFLKTHLTDGPLRAGEFGLNQK